MQRSLGILRLALRLVAIEMIGRLLYYTGILFLIGLLRQRIGCRRLLVPMYHRISAPGVADSASLLEIQRGVPLQLFQRHLRVFRWFGPLLTLDEAIDRLHDRKCPLRSAVALTFDDGYRDTVTLAVPALRASGARATIFPVVRTASGSRPLWWDELTDILSRGRGNTSDALKAVSAILNGHTAVRTRADVSEPGKSLEATAEFLCQRFVELSDAQRDSALNVLASRLGVAVPNSASAGTYATWDELRSAAADGYEIGGHTVDHFVLTCEEPQTVQEQVAGSRTALEQKLQVPIRSFAYPNGRHDATVRALTAAAGYRCAVTVQAGINYAGTDPYELRRVPVHRERPFHLAFKLAFYGCVKRG
jgi:peptidoglycan/xylan/chitin deacetylase (PgdA/CDA1 family)